MGTVKLPPQLKGIIWTKKFEDLDLQQDEIVIIHHVLRYGKVEDIAWLLQAYPHEKIKQIFLSQPLNIYSKSSFHFAKSTVLNISQDLPDESRYIQSFS